jgi:rod shape-determining protein MreD
VLLKGNWMNYVMPGSLDVDLVIVAMAFLLVRQGTTGAAIFGFVQGLVVDIYSAGVLGLFTFLYLIAFLAVHYGSRFFDIYSAKGQVILVAIAVFLKHILFVAFLQAFPMVIARFSYPAFLPFALSAVATGLVAPIFFYLFRALAGIPGGGLQEGS